MNWISDYFFQVRNFAGRLVLFFGRKLLVPSTSEIRARQWFSDNGDKTLRLNYELNQQSIVLDLGGYEGQWASDIYSMYRCKVLIFEPVSQFFKRIEQRYQNNTDIQVYEFGLGAEDAELSISVNGASSTAHKNGNARVNAKLVKASNFFHDNNISKIDLLKINIEGGEFDLLDNLIDSGFIASIKNIQVQFHDFFPNSSERMKKIQENLCLTHRLTYQYEYVWENWQLK